MIPLATVMISSFLLFNCNGQSNDVSMAALALAAANSTADSSSSDSTPVTQLVFFATDNGGTGWGSGNLGGRSGADAKCASVKPAALSCPNGNHALLSFSAGDQISNMQTNYGFSSSLPVKAWDGSNTDTELLSQWSNMLSGGTFGIFTTNMSTAFGLSGVPYLATGSDASGNVSANNCSGFSSSSGVIDDVDMGNGSFLPEGTGDCGTFQSGLSDNEYMICVCY